MNFRMKFPSMKTTVKIRLVALVVSLGVCLSGCRGVADSVQAAIPSRPSPQRLVNDLAGLFSASQVRQLEAMLVAFDDSTSNQIAVVTVKDLEGRSPADYAYRIGQDWGVGGKDFNNGIVVLVKPKDERSSGQVSIQVGYGLEGAIPDVYAKRIIDNQMIPHFRENDYYGGVQAACEQLMAYASGEISVARDRDEVDAEDLVALLILLGLLLLVFLYLSKHSGGSGGSGGGGGGRYIYIGPLGRGWSGGSWGGPSGGSWGGGSSWGGGGGFGGFGGGSFGGGGASGSW